MKEFQFLEQHPYFIRKRETHDKKGTIFYYFKDEKEGYASVKIFREAGREIEWLYDPRDSGKLYSYDQSIEKAEKWFRELIGEASAMLEKRDKLRNIFIKSQGDA